MDDNPILLHFESPYHRGAFSSATHTQSTRNPSCGDEVTLQLKVTSAAVETAWFTAAGCMVSQAAASMLCKHIEGRSLNELRDFDAESMLALIGVPLTPHRQQCGLLPFKALKTLIYSL